MDISEMKKREDLLPILCRTLTHFFSDIYGEKIVFSDSQEYEGVLYITERPGILGPAKLSKAGWETIMAEYSPRGSIAKYGAMRCYVAVCTVLRSCHYLAKIYYKCEDSDFSLGDYLISPNNKSVRIYDYKNDTVYSVVKDGFTNAFLSRQVEFRKSHNYPFLLPLIKSGDDWFSEEILKGHALVRTRSEEKYNESKKAAIESIRTLFSETCREISVKEYAASLREKLHAMLDTADGIDEKYVEKIKRYIEYEAGSLLEDTALIRIGMTHGDFQEGNIWRDRQGRTWVYDWETVDIRSEWYDFAVMFWKLRKKGLYRDIPVNTENIREYINYGTDSIPNKTIRRIICLEDVLFQLEETAVLPVETRNGFLQILLDKIGGSENNG